MRARRILLWTVVIGAVVASHALWHQVELFGSAEAQQAGRLQAVPRGIQVFSDRDAIRFVARDTTVTLSPEGIVRINAPTELRVNCLDDVKIEGSDITLDASSDVIIEANSNFVVDASKLKLGRYNSDIVMAEGDCPLMMQDSWERIVVSERAKAR